MSNLTTSVVGYFNPNDYPMQIVVAEHNLTIQLQPKQYIVDRAGRLVNDPTLDRYVGKGRLSRATNPKQKVAVVKLISVNHVAPTGQPATQFTHPVYEARGFMRDANGQMVPVMAAPTAPVPTVAPPASYNPVKAMSVAEAKRLRLIKPTRQVREDYGVEDTNGAPIPGEKIPFIQCQTDTAKGQTGALPEALAKPLTAAQAQLAQGMQISQGINPESPQVLDQVAQAVKNMPLGTQQEAMVQPTPPPPTPMGLLKSIPPPIPTNPAPSIIIQNTALPEPQLGDELIAEEEISPASEASSVPAIPTASVPLPVMEDADAAPTGDEANPADPLLKCPLCPGKDFHHPGYLKRHINTKHQAQAEQLLQKAGLL
jgi:hypothetical protein